MEDIHSQSDSNLFAFLQTLCFVLAVRTLGQILFCVSHKGIYSLFNSQSHYSVTRTLKSKDWSRSSSSIITANRTSASARLLKSRHSYWKPGFCGAQSPTELWSGESAQARDSASTLCSALPAVPPCSSCSMSCTTAPSPVSSFIGIYRHDRHPPLGRLGLSRCRGSTLLG